MVPLLLTIVNILEILAGFTSVMGVLQIFISGRIEWGFVASVLIGMNFFTLLLGQRMAKDYAGARAIVIHLIPAMMLVYLFLI